MENSSPVFDFISRADRQYETFLQIKSPQRTNAVVFILLSAGMGAAAGSLFGVPLAGASYMAVWALTHIVVKDVFHQLAEFLERIPKSQRKRKDITFLAGVVSSIKVASVMYFFFNVGLTAAAIGGLFLLSIGSLMLLWIIGFFITMGILGIKEAIEQYREDQKLKEEATSK